MVNQNTCIPLIKLTAGGRSFSSLAPKLWNSLPTIIREADTLSRANHFQVSYIYLLRDTYMEIFFVRFNVFVRLNEEFKNNNESQVWTFYIIE